MIINILMLIIGICIGYGFSLGERLKDIEDHCQELLQLNDDWFKHLEAHTETMKKLTEVLSNGFK